MIISLQSIAKIFDLSTESTLEVDSYFIDSRKACPRGIFFALKGEKVDGHDFLEEVAAKGAYAAVVDKAYKGPGFGLELFFVEDVLEALQDLARQMLLRKKMKVIAITGSVGKSTTKEMIYHILNLKYKVHASQKSYNSQRMLPISILEAKGDEEYIVLEMAMTEKGHIEKLVSIAPPDIVVLTPITYTHSENFDSLEDIAAAKAEIFSLKTEFAVIYVHNAKFKAVYNKCICHNVLYPTDISLVSPYKESHFTENFVAAYEVAKHIGMSDNQIRLASLSLASKQLDHRFQKIEKDGVLFVDDSYNANVRSTTAALKNLPETGEGGRKIFVFGEMKELGTAATASHQMVANAALKEVDIVLCIGRETKEMVTRFEEAQKQGFYFYDFRSLKDQLYKIVKKGDVVLLKGSNSHKLWMLLENPPIKVK